MFWLHASSAPRFDSSVRDVVAQLQIPGHKDPGANVYQLFRSWLRDPENGSWVLVLDNADDVRFLLQPPASERADGQDPRPSSGDRCLDYLPPSSHGKFLFTTRSLSAALQVTDRSNVVMIEPMGEAHALLLLQRKLQPGYDQDHCAELVKELDFMPLAMAQAAAYIRKQARRSSISDYVQKLRKSDKSMVRLLARDDGDTRRDREATNSILLTWQISFDYIQEQRTSAADLLSLMSCFDRQSIPEALLNDMSNGWGKAATDLSIHDTESTGGNDSATMTESVSSTSSESENEEFTEDIQTLLDYAFISMTGGETSFEMHRLVQLATQGWLESQKTLENYQSHFISSLDDAFPEYASFEDWDNCQMLLPHAAMTIAMKFRKREVALQHASLLRKLGWYAQDRDDLALADNAASRSLRLLENLLGPKHLDTANSMGVLASVYYEQNLYEQSVKLHVQALEVRKALLGLEAPDTATSMNNLGVVYSKMGLHEQAIKIHSQTLEVRKTLFGVENQYTATSMTNLAGVYLRQGLYEQAAELHKQALEIRQKVQGPENPETLLSMSNLASVYFAQGLLAQAEELYEQAIDIKRKVLGSKHPDTAAGLNLLAAVYSSQGLHDRAAELELQGLIIMEEALGLTHPRTVLATANMALGLFSSGRTKNAIEQLRLAVVRSSVSLGSDHPMTISMITKLEDWKKQKQALADSSLSRKETS